MAQLDKIRLSGVTYDIIDATAVHSLDGYWTTGETTNAITAATNALAESIAEQGYQTSGDVQNAISGKADTTAVTEAISEAVSGKVDTDTYTAYTAATDTVLEGKADVSDIPSVSGYADSVKYNSTSKYVEFYHGGTGGTKVFEYDASPFLIDGMVQNVEIKDVDIVQTFHTGYDAQYNHQPYFTAANYNVGGRNAVGDCNSFSIGSSAGAQISLMVISSGGVQTSVYSRYYYSGGTLPESEYVTASVSDKVFTFVPSEGYRISELDIVNMSKSGMPYNVGQYCDLSVTAATTCLVISFNTDAGKQDINIPLTNIFDPSNYYTKSEVNTKLNEKVSNATYTAYTAATDTALGNKADTTAMTEAISEATSGKVDSDTYTAYTASTDTALSGKQETLVSGTNIKTINNESLLGSGNITVGGGNSVEVSGTTLVFL